ncbi:MAG: cytochrome c [Acidimicrobiia bacterium]|nr:cytochrome c [Acidimicrobiia bacterium]
MAGRFRITGAVCLIAMLIASCAPSDPPSGLDVGREVYATACSVCHGNSGQGVVGPALSQVALTWPDCADQIRWTTLGSDRWRVEVGDTYGATAKPVLGGMLPQEGLLTPHQIAAVTAFTRVTYGGVDGATALDDCGVAGS